MLIYFLFISIDVEKKYPGLQDKVKQMVKDVITKARSKLDLFIRVVNNLANSTADKAKEVRQVFRDLFLKLKSKMQ